MHAVYEKDQHSHVIILAILKQHIRVDFKLKLHGIVEP